MPANLPPQYFEVEKKYREAKTIPEKIDALKEMLAIVPKHKGTEKLQAEIKRKIAKLKDQLEKKGKAGKRGPSFYIGKEGAGQLVLVGPPNVGKSQIVASLTNASPEIADYPFSTRLPCPGMMPFENIQIQLVDLPPISPEYMEGWICTIIRNSDGVLLVIDLSDPDPLTQTDTTLKELEKRKIKLVKEEANDGMDVSVARKKTLLIGNKIDREAAEENFNILKELYADSFPIIAISAKEGYNLEELKRKLFEMLDIVRVYSKPPAKKVDKDKPFILKKGSTLLDFAEAVHKDFAERLKYARVWGTDKFNGQRVNKDYILMDEDIIELHI